MAKNSPSGLYVGLVVVPFGLGLVVVGVSSSQRRTAYNTFRHFCLKVRPAPHQDGAQAPLFNQILLNERFSLQAITGHEKGYGY